jgi:hypothetical protein
VPIGCPQTDVEQIVEHFGVYNEVMCRGCGRGGVEKARGARFSGHNITGRNLLDNPPRKGKKQPVELEYLADVVCACDGEGRDKWAGDDLVLESRVYVFAPVETILVGLELIPISRM